MMQYNSQRPKLIISEYGRHIQKMIDNACAIEDREQRNLAAKAIIAVMGQLNPHLRDQNDFRHKLWDHLFIMSDFRESLSTKPSSLQYPNNQIRYRHYGKIIEKMIDNAQKIEDPELKTSMVSAVAHHLKKSYLAWNRDSVADDIIFKDLKDLSAGTLEMPDGTQLGAATEVLTANYSQGQGKKFNRNKQKQKPFKRKFGTSNSY
jgi:hypothetical protein